MSAFGMQLHAATTVDGRDRKQLERLCRYMLRPPFAHDTVQALEGGRVRVHFKAPWRSGLRARIIPPAVVPAPEQQLTLRLVDADAADDDDDAPVSSPSPSRIGWAKLLARVFELDVTICRKCGGRMRVLEVVDAPGTQLAAEIPG